MRRKEEKQRKKKKRKLKRAASAAFFAQMAEEKKRMDAEAAAVESKREKRRTKKASKGGDGDAAAAVDEEGSEKKDADAGPSFSERFGGFMKDIQETEAVKAVSGAAKAVSEEAAKTKEALDKEGEEVAKEEKKAGKGKKKAAGESNIVTLAAKETVKEVVKEFTESDDGKRASPYQVPLDRRRAAVEQRSRRRERVINANDDTVGVELHKSSVWESRWKDVTENSEFATKVSDAKIQFEESENVVARMVKFSFDKITSLGSDGSEKPEDDESLVIQEIRRLDPGFDKDAFTTHIETAVAPAVLEAYYAGDLQVLEEWCSDMCYKKFEAEFQAREQLGQIMECQILDLDSTELLQCQQTDEYPILIFTFSTVTNLVVRNRVGEIVEGGEDDVKKTMWIIGMRRNPDELDRLLAWEVVDINAHGSQDYY